MTWSVIESCTSTPHAATNRGRRPCTTPQRRVVTSKMDIVSLLTVVSLLLVAQVAGSGDGAKEYEWGGTFAVPEDNYAWTMAMKKNKWADPSMKVAIMATTGTDAAALDAVEAAANTLLGGNCTLAPGTSAVKLAPSTTACYTLTPDPKVYASIFKFDLSGVKNVAIFAEHVPTEFERNTHYLIDEDGHDVEPVAEKTTFAAPEEHSEWGGMLAACFVVNCCTLIGLLTLAPCISKTMNDENKKDQWISGSCAFAGGALLAAAAFLMLPEGVLLVSADKEASEGTKAARLGTALLFGFIVGLVVDAAVAFCQKNEIAAIAPIETGKDEESPAIVQVDAVLAQVAFRSGVSVVVGDALHNLADGFFIGAAFKVCGSSVGWTVAMGAFAHELAQELADFFVLVGPAGMSVPKAIFLNVLSGLTVFLGAIIVMGADVGATPTGLILMCGAGTYIYIGCVECVPRAFSPQTTAKMKIFNLGIFILGALAIGLVLIGHKHCEAEGGHGH